METAEYKTEDNFALRIELRVKNAELARAREGLGLTLEKAAGMIGISSNTLCKAENLKAYPSAEIQKKVCDFYTNKGYFMLKEEVFPYELSSIKARKMIAEKEIPKESLVSLSYVNKKLLPVYEPLKELYDAEMQEGVLRSLDNLTDREAKILKLRFGLESREPMTLLEVGKKFKITQERVRQTEAKALKKLRHPSNAKRLGELVEA